MKKKWFPATELPSQGYKILCKAGGGDYYVAQRFGPYWVPLPFVDSQLAKLDPPDLWSHIDFEGDNKGYVMVMVADEEMSISIPMSVDELEQKHPDVHIDICEAHYEFWIKTRNDKKK